MKYTKEFKLMVIKDYLLGNGSSYDLAQKYKIPSKSIVLDWVSKYNNGKDIQLTDLYDKDGIKFTASFVE